MMDAGDVALIELHISNLRRELVECEARLNERIENHGHASDERLDQVAGYLPMLAEMAATLESLADEEESDGDQDAAEAAEEAAEDIEEGIESAAEAVAEGADESEPAEITPEHRHWLHGKRSA
jgi:hypothetical protein